MPQWIHAPVDENTVQTLQKKIRVSFITAQILLNRGLKDPQKARDFLQPSLDQLHDPNLFNQMHRAVSRVFLAIHQKELILIYGDYDVDGVSGASLLFNYFRFLKTPVRYYSPDRIQEGYGLHLKAIERFAQEDVKVIITIDCGITNVQEVQRANQLGIDVIITDHHESPEALPNAHAILNPKLPDSGYPFSGLCGTGVAFKFAWALAQRLCNSKKVSPEFRRLLLESLSLVALATVADMVPLVDENRVLVHFGLTSFSIGAKAERYVFHGVRGHKGLEALIHVAKLEKKEGLTEEEIGFKLGPMMNAAGRLSRAMLGIELLTTQDSQRAYELASELHQTNMERQKIEKVVFEQAKQQFSESEQWQQFFGIVVADARWHPGVIGIVASKMVEHFHRPTLVISLQNGIGKGSGRTLGKINLYQILKQLKSHLIQVGGHAAAAGFSIEEAQIPLFRKAFDVALKAHISSSDLVPQIHIDQEILLSDVDARLIRELRWLMPFGTSNPSPLFSTSRDLTVAGTPKRVGSRGEHLTFYVSQYKVTHKAIAFFRGDEQERITGKNISIVYIPKMNHFKGKETIQLEIKDFKILH